MQNFFKQIIYWIRNSSMISAGNRIVYLFERGHINYSNCFRSSISVYIVILLVCSVYATSVESLCPGRGKHPLGALKIMPAWTSHIDKYMCSCTTETYSLSTTESKFLGASTYLKPSVIVRSCKELYNLDNHALVWQTGSAAPPLNIQRNSPLDNI